MLLASIGADEHLRPVSDELRVERIMDIFDSLVDQVQIDIQSLLERFSTELSHGLRAWV